MARPTVNRAVPISFALTPHKFGEADRPGMGHIDGILCHQREIGKVSCWLALRAALHGNRLRNRIIFLIVRGLIRSEQLAAQENRFGYLVRVGRAAVEILSPRADEAIMNRLRNNRRDHSQE